MKTTSSRKNLSTGLLAVATASTLIASSCCVLPLVLVLAGITGAWMTTLTALRPVTPFFTGIALIALAWAGAIIFRPASACATDEDTACGRTRPRTKMLFLACAALAALLLLFPLVAPWFY